MPCSNANGESDPEHSHRFPRWKRWGFLVLFLVYWGGRLLQSWMWDKKLLLQVLWSGERSPDEVPWLVFGIALELFIVAFFPLWYTRQTLRLPDVRREIEGLRLAWPLPARERFVPWQGIDALRPTLAFSWIDLAAGGAWLVLRDGDQIPISYGLSGGVELIDELERRIATRDR